MRRRSPTSPTPGSQDNDATAVMAAAPVTAWLRSATQHLTRIGGALVLVTGAYVTYYGVYELRVNNGGDTGDPVIEVAARIQRTMSAWVGTIGVLTVVRVLIVIVGAAAVFGWLRLNRRRRTAQAATHAGLVSSRRRE